MNNENRLKLNNGWVEQAEHIYSPNFNQRPIEMEIDAIIIHGISLPPGKFGSSDINDFFTNQLDVSKDDFYKQIKNVKVSAHFLIRRDGKLIQYVNLNKRAWHAGQSNLEGHCDCNNFSIGIELEGTDTIMYEDKQYQQLAYLVSAIQNEYPQITEKRIIGHSDIAPGRKTDPGKAFNWEYFFKVKDKNDI